MDTNTVLVALGMVIAGIGPTLGIFATGRVAARAREAERADTERSRKETANAVEQVRLTAEKAVTAAAEGRAQAAEAVAEVKQTAKVAAKAVAEVAEKATVVAEAVKVVAEKTDAAANIAAESQRAANAAEEASKKRDDAIHTLVNDNLTTEKRSRLVLMKSLLALLEDRAGPDATGKQITRMDDLKNQIAELEAEITKRDAVAASLPKVGEI